MGGDCVACVRTCVGLGRADVGEVGMGNPKGAAGWAFVWGWGAWTLGKWGRGAPRATHLVEPDQENTSVYAPSPRTYFEKHRPTAASGECPGYT